MSAPHARPTPALALYAYARSLRDAAPGAPPPRGGHPLPATARPPYDRAVRLPYKQARETVTGLLRDRIAGPGTARAAAGTERGLAATGVRDHLVFHTAAALDPADPAAARALARRLVRDGTTVHGVAAGLGLLTRLGEPEDVPYLRALGALHDVFRYAVEALDPLDRPAAALLWLTHYPLNAPRGLVEAVAARDHAAVREQLLGLAPRDRLMEPAHARRVAEATGLVDLLGRAPEDTALPAQALRVLARMVTQGDHGIEILAYADATALYGTVAERAHLLSPAPGHQARLVTLAQELHSGASRLLAWPPGRRETVLARLLEAVREPAEAGRRADWIRRTARHLRAAGPAPAPGLRVEVAVADPAGPTAVETRILVDGRPILPVAFPQGRGDTPEELLDAGALRAAAEHRAVRLGVTSCAEACCGALYVTVRREGRHVVWDGGRRPGGTADPSAYRFDADAYDAEIARAENDHSWTWPARHTARLIAAGLRDRPELLTRWGLRRGWISTYHDDPDTTVVTFTEPPAGGDGDAPGEPGRFHQWRLPDDGRPPAERAAEALRRMAETDPRTLARRP
ncbi:MULTISPECIES: hypothetical protein [Streptomyces]|uniref:HEAT repeat domain-containing protein n=2 Tax=Streptomyces TaxID=1883 RepID=A0ABU4KH86_9ACTN|nr:hypothetical protein [Streptomyces roseolus]MDX2297174.1 hypothetical protein [Streptomyces roseolus]